jgi:hypothetical protein
LGSNVNIFIVCNLPNYQFKFKLEGYETLNYIYNNKYKPINTLEQFYTFYYLFPLSRLIFWSSQIAIHSFRRLHYVTCKPRWYGREGKTDVVKLMNMAEEKKHPTLNHVSFLSNYSISFRTNIFLVFFNYQISLRWPLHKASK